VQDAVLRRGADFTTEDTYLKGLATEIAVRESDEFLNRYQINEGVSKNNGAGYEKIPTYAFTKEVALSYLGTPLFFPMTIDGVLLPNAPLITVSGIKNVIKTPVASRDFTVKEIVSLDDYKINIKGIATNYDPINGVAKNTSSTVYEEFPEDWFVLLNNLYKRKQSEKTPDTISLPVQCDYLRMLGIHYLVIESIDFPPMAGVQSALAYEMKAVSDENIELVLADK
jgi:hypothetical protein